MEDKELFVLKSLYKRDYNAFHYLYESYFSKMVLFAESYVYDEEEAKDLVQDLFFYIWDHADSLLIKTSLKAYLFTSLRNRCLNALRDRKIVDSCNDKLLEAQLFAGIKDIEINETVEMRLQNALNTLPDKCREIILLKISRQMTKNSNHSCFRSGATAESRSRLSHTSREAAPYR